MLRPLIVLAALMVAVPALAAKIAVVDFQRAVNETTEGVQAQSQLEAGYKTRQQEIERQRAALAKSLQDYEARKLILNEEARRAAEQDIMGKQEKLQGDVMRYEQEMQAQYMEVVQVLDDKMRKLATTIAKEKGFDLVLDQAAVVYAGGEAVDMTAELIRRYNAK